MRIDRLALAESKVPRYTSYPTAAQFSPSVGAAELAGWLGSQEPKLPASLYVHVPFCRKLCLYCGCNTSITSRAAPVARFLDALAREIDIVAALLPGRLSLAHLHLGGGTPSILEAGQFATLMARLRARFDLAPGAEIAIEADPRGLDAARIAAFAAKGVTRVSLGVQDLDPDVQRAIDRLQPLEMVAAATRSLRAAGYVAVGIDHFARPEDPLALAARQGALGRNFQGYTTDSAGCLIGLGPSAISSFAQGIAQNATRSDDWATAIAAGMPATCRGVRRDDGDRRRGRIIERLMCDFAVDLAADIAADPSLAAILDGLGDLAACGLVRRDGSRLAIPADAHGFARVVAARFDAYLAPAATRHAMAV